MRNSFFVLMKVLSLVMPGVVTVIALLAATTFSIWQSSHQVIFGTIIENVIWLFWAAAVFLAVQFAARFVVEYQEQQTSDRRTAAIRAIGDLIGEGTKLKSRAGDPSSTADNMLTTLEPDISDWEQRTTQCLEKYEPKLISILTDTSGIIPPAYIGLSQMRSTLINRINNRLIRLRDLLSLVAIH